MYHVPPRISRRISVFVLQGIQVRRMPVRYIDGLRKPPPPAVRSVTSPCWQGLARDYLPALPTLRLSVVLTPISVT